MFSVVQLKKKLPQLEEGEICLPEATTEGQTTLNELTVSNKIALLYNNDCMIV